MKDICAMVMLGFFAGMISGLWSRLIRSNMILGNIGKRLEQSQIKFVGTTKKSWLAEILLCLFCITPYICALFSVWYVVSYRPGVFEALIGFFACLGAGNTVCEIIKALRNE